MLVYRPCILFIDAYDSFTNNIISLLTTTLACSVRVIHIDSPGFETDEALISELQHYDAVVCGPGPGHPANENDVGLIQRVWSLRDQDVLPVLGICLGFQSLCLAFGAHMKILNEGQHGRVRRINHVGEADPKDRNACPGELFDGVEELRATLYHSLYVATSQNFTNDGQWQENKWNCLNDAKDLLPLAWAENELSDSSQWKDDRILMAVRHRTKPFWGLQYHPESICTNKEGKMVIQNWFVLADRWNRTNGRKPRRDGVGILAKFSTLDSLLSRVEHRRPMQRLSNATPKPLDESSSAFLSGPVAYHYESRVINLPDHISLPDIVEKLQGSFKERIILESSNAHIEGPGAAAVRGRYSIIGMDVGSAVRFEYHANNTWAKVSRPRCHGRSVQKAEAEKVCLKPYGGIWPLLADFLENRQVEIGDEVSPFWGGFMGYTTYELGLESIGLNYEQDRQHTRPDLCFVWITRSLVLDHLEKKIYIQQLADKSRQGADMWMDSTASLLQSLFRSSTVTRRRRSSKYEMNMFQNDKRSPSVILPNNDVYESKVRDCQEQIRRGESYELCLTAETQVIIPRADSSTLQTIKDTSLAKTLSSPTPPAISPVSPCWPLYKRLRHHNPAPFASYIRLGPVTFLSASPERFLTWSRSGKCSLRPMKGTIRKSPRVPTLAHAIPLLQVPKETAENLMIVDLVRHDLHAVCGPGRVQVPRLMVVEEYSGVFQMISVVEGQIPQCPSVADFQAQASSGSGSTSSGCGMSDSRPDIPRDEELTLVEQAYRTRYTGLDVLSASLPPGSMTGAPKKRSCEILRDIEGRGRDRGLYSGVFGYMDVGGRGDFSVSIRCMFRWDDESFSRSVDSVGTGTISNSDGSGLCNGDGPDDCANVHDNVYAKEAGVNGNSNSDSNGDANAESNGSDQSQKIAQEQAHGHEKGVHEVEGVDIWHIGAGGAVTALSTPLAEREEMQTKLAGTLGVFGF